MNIIKTPANWREVFASKKSQNLGNGMFSPALKYETDRIYLFGAPSGFGKTFIACGEAVHFASRGYKTLYIHTEMSTGSVFFDRFSHCADLDKAIANLDTCEINMLKEINEEIDPYQVIVLDYVSNGALDGDDTSHTNLSRYMKTLDSYRKAHPDKMILVYAQLGEQLNQRGDVLNYVFEDCHNMKRSVDACFMLTPHEEKGKKDSILVKCTKDRNLDWKGVQGENYEYYFSRATCTLTGKNI